MEAVYSSTRVALKRGQKYQNPRFFEGVMDGAKGARIHGDYPEIAAAYKAAGLEVEIIGAPASAPKAPAEAPASTKAAIRAADSRRDEA